MFNFLSGKKAYIVAGATLLYALIGYCLGYIDGPAAMKLVFEGGGIATLRAAISKAAF